mmetsp:Transcript_31879/g.36248  ORF Transcript_31879/g.36248 Transcript_31879/m.36248 type:complete len:298 (-) Transcript_31879:115-1008(-)
MCIVFFALNHSSIYKAIFLTNRDEFLQRPTEKAKNWEGDDCIFAPRDLVGGGTWLGINPKSATFATLTNVRTSPDLVRNDTRTRGELVSNILKLDSETSTFEDEFRHQFVRAREDNDQYNPFNLLGCHLKSAEVAYMGSNFDGQVPFVMNDGVHSLSNGVLDDPTWPKCQNGQLRLTELIENRCGGEWSEKSTEWTEERHNEFIEECFKIMMNGEKITNADDLPKTGMPEAIEFELSSTFIEPMEKMGKEYGTMETTIITVDYQNKLSYHERWYSYQTEGIPKEKAQCENRSFTFQL